MANKQLFVSSDVQVALLNNVLIPQMGNGFWKDHRPAGHHKEWENVQISVSETQDLGPVNFKVPRTYNFINSDFLKSNEVALVVAAQAIKPNSTFRSVKKELIELSRIVGGRLTNKNGIPTKANRGVTKRGPVTTPEIVLQARETLARAQNAVKRTAVKKQNADDNVEIITTSSGATVRRVKVSS